jgi:hypothetical protein
MTTKKHALLYLIGCLTWVVVAVSSHASSISVHGFASIPGGPDVSFFDSLPGSGSVSGSCVTFNPANPSITSSASGSASQTSSVGPLGFSFAQNFLVDWSPALESDGRALAGAATVFQVSFVVVAAVDYQLTLLVSPASDFGFYMYSAELNGLILNPVGTSSGTLLPGSYVFTVSQALEPPPNLPDFLGGAEVADANGEMTFSGPVSVPDAGSTLSLLGFASLGLVALRRKLRC